MTSTTLPLFSLLNPINMPKNTQKRIQKSSSSFGTTYKIIPYLILNFIQYLINLNKRLVKFIQDHL